MLNSLRPSFHELALKKGFHDSLKSLKSDCTIEVEHSFTFKKKYGKNSSDAQKVENERLKVFYSSEIYPELEMDAEKLEKSDVDTITQMVLNDKNTQTNQDVIDIIKNHIDTTEKPNKDTLYKATGIRIADFEELHSGTYMLEVKLGVANVVMYAEAKYFYCEEGFLPWHDFDCGLSYRVDEDGFTTFIDGDDTEFVFDGKQTKGL